MTASRRLRSTVAAALIVSAAIVRAQTRQFDLMTAGIDDIQAAVTAGALTYEQLIRLYSNRIDAYDKNGPRLNAVITINPNAVAMARQLDQERRANGLRGPLHGIPVAVKDNIDVADLPSTGGTLALAGSRPARDATVIQRLRAGGAIIFLKTNLDELALGSQGLSSLGGQTLSPYDLTRNPGGSSGGTAVAVNAGFAAVGLGTETGVSIRSPASNNALIGIVPTRGLVSRAGVIPISFTQDRIGVHAKSVVDAAMVLDAVRGFDPEDLVTSDSLGRADARPYHESDEAGLAGVRLGVLRDLFRNGAEFEAGNLLIDQQIVFIGHHGATIVDHLSTGIDLVSLMPTLRVNGYELRVSFDAYLRNRRPASRIKSLADLVATGQYLKSLTRQFQQALARGPLDRDTEYLGRLASQRRVREALISLMDEHRLDALVYPFKSLGAPRIGVADSGTRDNPISAITGLPAIVVPAGIDHDGLPLAIEFLGRPFTEGKLIRLAKAYEQESRHRVAPTTAPALRGEQFSY